MYLVGGVLVLRRAKCVLLAAKKALEEEPARAGAGGAHRSIVPARRGA